MSKEAQTVHPVHELIAKRWSPYSYDSAAVTTEELQSLFEAARWAASSYNEQPWSFIVATKDDPENYEKALSCLVEFNQGWANAASVLVITCIATEFAGNGKPNAAAEHDLGLAVGNLSLEATARGLSVHSMRGILHDKAQEVFEIPSHVKPFTAIAIGHRLPDDQADAKDLSPRDRKPLREIVFSGKWGQSAGLAE